MEFLTPKGRWVADSREVRHRLFGLCDPALALLGMYVPKRI